MGGRDPAVAQLHERLLARRAEIEQAILTRVYAVSDPAEVGDPAYAEGLRAAVAAAIDYSLDGIQSSERNPPPIPPALLVQARIAARSGVGLDTVLRRCVSGHALFSDFLVEEAQKAASGIALKDVLRAQATLLDRLIAAISEEHRRDGPREIETGERRRLELVKRLLDGEPLDVTELAYDFQRSHVGLVARGPEAEEAIRTLAQALDCRSLVVCAGEQTTWGWIAAGRLDLKEVRSTMSSAFPSAVSLALGEPGEGLAGWRFSHRQARAALQIALRGGEPVVRYADVALLATIIQDDLLCASLHQLYLEPLEAERDGGKLARETLRAYFDTDRNVSSAAASLEVSRQTVTSRLQAIEERLGTAIEGCATEIDIAVRLGELEAHSSRET
jgi:DNA-binding PucR family transcriptional regulator